MPTPKTLRPIAKIAITVALFAAVVLGWRMTRGTSNPDSGGSSQIAQLDKNGGQPPSSLPATSRQTVKPAAPLAKTTNHTQNQHGAGNAASPRRPLPAHRFAEPLEPEPALDPAKYYVIINGQRAHSSRLLARLKTTQPNQTRDSLLGKMELQAKHHYPLTPAMVMLKSTAKPFAVANEKEATLLGEEMQERIKTLQDSGHFAYVEPDYIVTTDAIPTDSAFTNGQLWGLRNTGQNSGVAGADIDAVRAWDVTTGSTDVIVAVIDSGIRYTHQDLAGQMWQNHGEIPSNGLDDDGDGYIDNVYGIDARINSGNPNDDIGHGTHCAGTIGAAANGGGQHVGVAWSVKLMACRFMSTGGGYTSDAIKCVNFAVAKGARILSNSWGGGGYSQALADAIAAARDNGVLFVAAAGNSTRNTDTTPNYPSCYDLSNIITVAALDSQDKLAYFSNYGATSVDLGGPGVSIYSCYNASDTSYASVSGTSMAAPHVAGVAALVVANIPDIPMDDLRERILSGTVPIAALEGKAVTGGRLNAYNALVGEPDGTLEVSVSPYNGTELIGGRTVSFFVQVRDFIGVSNATVTGNIAGLPSIAFKNDGTAPDATANNHVYSASITIPLSATSFSLQIAVTAPGKTAASITNTYPVLLPPPNDNFSARIAINGNSTTVTGTNLVASKESGEPGHAGSSGGRSVWWSWTATTEGTVTFSTDGSDFDTLLAVYTGSAVNSLNAVASDNDSGTWLNSLVSIPVTVGTTYQIAIDGMSGTSGNITLKTAFAPTPVPPVNDNFASAIALSGTEDTDTGTNLGATKETGEPNHAGNTGANSVWWTWTAPSDGTVTVHTDGSLFDTILGVYVGTSVSTLTTIASDNDNGDGTRSLVIFGATAGTTYRIAVAGYNGSGGNISLSLALVANPPSPANNQFADRAALTGAATSATGTNIGASKETGEPDHAQNSGGKSVWWTWTAPSSGSLALTTAGSSFDTLLAVYTGSSVNALTLVAGNDQDPLGGSTSRVVFSVTAGTTYHIAVDGMNNGLNTALGNISLNLTLTEISLPSNDMFASRAAVTAASATLAGTNVGATSEVGEPNHYGAASKSVWWSWTAPAAGTIVINTDGSGFDTVLAIYTGTTLSSLTKIASDDDSGAGNASQIVLNAVGGTSYQIAVDGLSGGSGSITLNINPTIPLPIITVQPASLGAWAGDPASFAVNVTSTTPVTYQWKKDGVNLVNSNRISGANGSSLRLTSLVATDAGNYTLVVTNAGGSTTSNAATLTITVPPAPIIYIQPLDKNVYLGQPFNFYVNASQTGVNTYQWQKSTDGGSTFTTIPYAYGASFTVYSAQPTDAAKYRVIVTNGGGSTTSNVVTATVTTPTPPAINTHPASQNVYLGQSVTLFVNASLNGTTSYQWQKSTDDGATFANIQYANGSSFYLYGTIGADSGQYRVIVTNAGGSTTSNAAIVTVSTPPAPVITSHPASQSVYLGQSLYFNVSVTAYGNVTYQWQKSADGGATFTDVSGATSYSYNISNPVASHAGQYRVVVTNPGGSTTSNAATVTLITPPPPVINAHPDGQTVYAGDSVYLSVSVSITGTTTYQWQKSSDNGATFLNISSATGSSYNIYSSQVSDSGHYRVVVTNPGGTTTSNPAVVTVSTPPAPIINTQPQNQSLYPGQTLNLNVSTSNTGTTTYQWQKSTDGGVNFTNILYATSYWYSIYSVKATDAGTYRVIVSNGGGSVTSNPAVVTVNPPPSPVITSQPVNQSVYVGSQIYVSVTVTSYGTTTYQWQKSTDGGLNFTNIAGATSQTHSLYATTSADAGQYRVIVANSAGSVTSNAATISFLTTPPPVITTQPSNRTLYVGEMIELYVTANSSGTTTYQWQKSTDSGAAFANVAGGTNSAFYVNYAQVSDAGRYRVVVTNASGSATSNTATITVTLPPAPVIATHPANQNIYGSQTLTLGVVASQTGPTTYQWQKSVDGGASYLDISGATWSSYNINSAQPSDAGLYRVIVTNTGGSTTSNAATVSVNTPPAPVITTHPLSQTLFIGASFSLQVTATTYGNATYQWQISTDGGVTFNNIAGATSNYFYIYGANASHGGQYRVVVANLGGSTTSTVATIAVNTPPPPVITTHPANRTIYIGESFTLNVSVNSSGSTTYQWQKSTDGGATFTNIPNSTSSYFDRYSTVSSDAGLYRVIVTNAGGSTTSNAATVTINAPPAPVITTHPADRTRFVGDTFYLNVSVNSSGTTTYQWQKSTDSGATFTHIIGATSSLYYFRDAQVSQSGQYRVVVTNAGGSATSNVATVTISVPGVPVITTQPRSQSVYIGESIGLSVAVTTSGATTYQWQKSTDSGATFTNISNATDSYHSIYTSAVEDAGQYRVVVSNGGGSTTSSVATVTVSPPPVPVITTQPANQTIYEGQSFYLSVSVTSYGTTSYQWQKSTDDGTTFANISYATSSSYNRYSTTPADAGQYRVIVSNGGGSVTSNAATVTINPPAPPTFTTQPSDLTVLQGSTISLYGSASSSSSVAYQWYKDNVALSGITSSSFNKTNAALTDGGKYKLSATNSGGTTYSREATVTITPATPPVFVVQPQNEAACVGDDVTFTAAATANPAATYQWYKNTVAIPGATSATLTITAVTTANHGDIYKITATNLGGTATSNNATLTVYAADSDRALGLSPATRTVGCGRVVYPLMLRSKGAWTATTNANWIKLSASSGTHSHAFEVLVAPNPLPVERTATITIGQLTHTLTQRAAGTSIRELWAVGANDFGQLGDYRLPPIKYFTQSETGVTAIAAGYQHTLFVKTGGTLFACGYNNYGQLGTGNTTLQNTPVQIATNVSTVSAGVYHSTFLKTDGTLWTFGNNSYGQLGDGTTTSRLTPVQIATDVAFVAAGGLQTFFIKTNGTLWASGANEDGTLGDGTTTDRSTPVQVATNVASVSAGLWHALFVKTDGTLWAMGHNVYGQLGDGTTASRSTPVQISTDVRSASCGLAFSVFVKNDNNLYAMGSNSYGQLGLLYPTNQSTPTSTASGVQSAAAGYYHTLLVHTAGNVAAAGDNVYSKLGNGSTAVQFGFVNVPSTGKTIAAGGDHSLLIKTDGSLWMAGSNFYGQLGHASASIESRSKPVSIASEVDNAAAGDNHSLYVKTDGSLWTMGDNTAGQLADGSMVNRSNPVAVATSMKGAAAGYNHTLLLKSDGTLHTAGANSYGQLGLGITSSRYSPGQIATDVATQTAGQSHSLFLKTDGTLHAAGSNSWGQVGDGSYSSQANPVQILTNVRNIAAGSLHNLAVKTDNSLWAWGNNSSYQFGNGTTFSRSTPVQIAGTYLDAAAGEGHSLFLKSDRTLWAVGENNYGQLGNGSDTTASAPVQVASNIQALSAGQNHSLWIDSAKTLWGTGDGSSGQLGNDSYAIRNRATNVAANVESATAGGAHTLFIASGDIRPSFTAPTISYFTPTNPAAGATITINGSAYTDVLGVYFNNVPATSYNAASTTQITAVAPATNLANLRITVATFDGVISSDNTQPPAPPTPPQPSPAPSSGGGGGGAPSLAYLAALAIAAGARRALLARRR